MSGGNCATSLIGEDSGGEAATAAGTWGRQAESQIGLAEA